MKIEILNRFETEDGYLHVLADVEHSLVKGRLVFKQDLHTKEMSLHTIDGSTLSGCAWGDYVMKGINSSILNS